MKAKYLGLELSSPVIGSSSPYTASKASVAQCVRNGAGAVVLKSIFEEQILRHAAALEYASDAGMGDSGEYLERYLGDAYKAEFLQLVRDAAGEGVPVIASINCIASAAAWTDYAVMMAEAGASALELNIFLQPTDRHRKAAEIEQEYADVVRAVAAAVKIPVSVKLPQRLTNVLSVADALLARGARGVVLYNRFFEPDIDIERMEFTKGNPFSSPSELRSVLRPTALCSAALPSRGPSRRVYTTARPPSRRCCAVPAPCRSARRSTRRDTASSPRSTASSTSGPRATASRRSRSSAARWTSDIPTTTSTSACST